MYDYIIDLLKSKLVEFKQKKRQRVDGAAKRCTLEDKSVERAERHAKIDAQTLKALTSKTDRRQISLTSEKTVYAGR